MRKWRRSEEHYYVNIKKFKDMLLLDNLLNKLDLKGKKELFYFCNKESWIVKFPYRIISGLEIIKPDAFYCFNDQPYILFFESPGVEKEKIIHKQVWNFNQTPVIFIVNANEIKIFNGFVFDKTKNQLKCLDIRYEEISFLDLQSGFFWQEHQGKFQNKTRVDYYLLENIKAARTKLTKNLKKEIANNLIGRLIFSRYLIDRKVKIDSTFIEDNNENESFLTLIKNKTKLYKYFDYLKKHFEGDLFPVENGEFEKINDNHLNVLYLLFSGGKIETNQLSLFDIYDFSIIPIELISNIYERFIGGEQQNESKSFYTPPFLVDYILSQTVEPFLEKRKDASCRILDPSCGSAIFLVESLRKIVSKAQETSNRLTQTQLKKLAQDNIFGIDTDENAINIAIFSIYITLLDYQEPKDIEAFKFPSLIGKNFFIANFFDLNSNFNKAFKNIDFEFILGNPPWGDIKEGLHRDYLRALNIPISDNQIAQSFLIRSKDFSSNSTKCILIVTSKILYNLQGDQFRRYFLDKFLVSRVVELSPVRRQIFNKAIGPAVILFYSCSFNEDTSNNPIEYISIKPNLFFKLFKTLVIEKYDYKKILQKYFKEYDWLWKVMLYGNILDFYFIKMLKNNFSSINDLIEEKNFFSGQGVQVSGGDYNDASDLIGKKYLDTKRSMLQRYCANTNKGSLWVTKTVHRPRDSKLFNAPFLLIKKGLTSDFKAVAAYSDQDMVFTDSVTAIKGEANDIEILKILVGLLNSKLFKYYILHTGSSVGIEREQSHNKEEKFTFPILIDNRIVKKVDELQLLSKKISRNVMKNAGHSEQLKIKENELNNLIFKLYGLNDIELDLIDYTLDISIPLIKNKKEPFLKPTPEQLKAYANLFFEHFREKFKKGGEFFYIEIYQTNYFIALNFKIDSRQPKENISFINDSDINNTLNKIGRLSIEQISQDLFMQKDIKGFESKSFYIIKPKEYKNWHKAIARLDLNEVMDALIRADIERQADNNNVKRKVIF